MRIREQRIQMPIITTDRRANPVFSATWTRIIDMDERSPFVVGAGINSAVREWLWGPRVEEQ